jgi:hypothetical protein
MLSSRYFLLVLTGCYRNLENPYRHHLTLKKLKLVVQTAKSMSAERNPNVFVNGPVSFLLLSFQPLTPTFLCLQHHSLPFPFFLDVTISVFRLGKPHDLIS